MKKIYLAAAIAAILCGWLVYSYTDGLRRAANAAIPKTPMVQVIAAAQDIPQYTEITEEMILLVDFPEEYAHADAAVSAEDVVGKRCNGDIKAGEIILTTVLGDAKETGASLSHTIPEGMRAMTIGVDVYSGVAGYIVEGDRVDLIRYEQAKDEGEKGTAAILLQDVQVLTTGDVTQLDTEATMYSGLTLVLSQNDCVKLTEATLDPQSSLYVVLRESKNEETGAAAAEQTAAGTQEG